MLLATIIQSISEFLPISSSAHLALFAHILEPSTEMKVALHIGTLISALLYYGQFLWNDFFGSITSIKRIQSSYWLRLTITTIPAVISGYIFRNTTFPKEIMGITSIIGGGLLFYAWKNKESSKTTQPPTLSDSLIIGICQMFSVIPGMSRMGMCLVGCGFLNMDKIQATHYTFMASIPVVLGAVVLNSPKIYQFWNLQWTLLTLLSAIIGYTTILLFLHIIRRIKYLHFGIYRIILGIILVLQLFLQLL